MSLDLTSLENAVKSLKNAVNITSKKEKEGNIDHLELKLLIAGVIQNFEFTYELCWKFMKRWLEINISFEEVDGITKKELFRIAAENKLIEDTGKWFEFHKARNKTTHIYDENIAEKVYSITKDFLPEAILFLKNIKKRND